MLRELRVEVATSLTCPVLWKGNAADLCRVAKTVLKSDKPSTLGIGLMEWAGGLRTVLRDLLCWEKAKVWLNAFKDSTARTHGRAAGHNSDNLIISDKFWNDSGNHPETIGFLDNPCFFTSLPPVASLSSTSTPQSSRTRT